MRLNVTQLAAAIDMLSYNVRDFGDQAMILARQHAERRMWIHKLEPLVASVESQFETIKTGLGLLELDNAEDKTSESTELDEYINFLGADGLCQRLPESVLDEIVAIRTSAKASDAENNTGGTTGSAVQQGVSADLPSDNGAVSVNGSNDGAGSTDQSLVGAGEGSSGEDGSTTGEGATTADATTSSGVDVPVHQPDVPASATAQPASNSSGNSVVNTTAGKRTLGDKRLGR